MTEQKTEQFLLLDAVNDFLTFKLDMFTFLGKIEHFREELIRFQTETNETIERLCTNKALADVAAMDLEMLPQAFDAYFETFDMLREFVMKNDRNNVTLMLGRIQQCTSALDSIVNAFAEKAMILRGPTKFPKLNLILDCRKQIEIRGEGYDRLKAAINCEKEEFGKNIAFLEKKSQNDRSPEISSLIETYHEALVVMDSVLAAVASEDLPEIQKLTDKLDEFYIRANGFNLELLARFFMSSHSFIPEANLLIQASIDFRQGRVIENVMLNAFDLFREKLVLMEEQISAFNDDSIESGSSWKEYFTYDEREEMARLALKMSEALESVRDSLVIYEQFIESGYTELLEQADNSLKETLKNLEEPARLMAEAGDRVGKVRCIKCGTSNPRERKTCSQCSAVLIEGSL